MSRRWAVTIVVCALPRLLSAQVITPSPQGINAVSSGIGVCSTGNCATWAVANQDISITSQITGTMTSLTLTAEATADGLSWAAIGVTNLATGTVTTTTTATGQFGLANTGIVGFRWRCTTYASGGANITLTRGSSSTIITGAAIPATPTTSVQFNDAGAFGGNSGFTFTKGTGTGLVTITGAGVGTDKTLLKLDASVTGTDAAKFVLSNSTSFANNYAYWQHLGDDGLHMVPDASVAGSKAPFLDYGGGAWDMASAGGSGTGQGADFHISGGSINNGGSISLLPGGGALGGGIGLLAGIGTVTAGGVTIAAGNADANFATAQAGSLLIRPGIGNSAAYDGSINLVTNHSNGLGTAGAINLRGDTIATGNFTLGSGTMSVPGLKIDASGYANFGATAGTGGYGVRDNSGVIEAKNSGGSWLGLPLQALNTTSSPTFNALTVTSCTGCVTSPVGATAGGTGQTTVTTGDLLYGSATNTWSKLAAVGAGAYVRSGGVTTAPLWSTLILPNAATTGALMAATSTNTVGSVAAVAAGQVLTSAGTSTVPAYSATPSVTGSYTANVANTSTNYVDGLVVSASTAAANNAQQYSPTIRLIGNAWDGASSSQPVEMRFRVQPIQGVSSQLALYSILNNGTPLQIGVWTSTGNFTSIGNLSASGGVNAATTYSVNAKMLASATAPTATTFCTTPSIPANNGTAAFTVGVGTSCATSVGTITLPAAATGWVAVCQNVTNPATNVVAQTGGSTTTVTVTNYARTTGIASNWTDSDVLRCLAHAY